MPRILITFITVIVTAFNGQVLAAGSTEKGKIAYKQKGCWQCHGLEGQGGLAGPRIGNTELTGEQLASFVRTTTGRMPPYSERLITDLELLDIHAYLQSRNRPANPNDIPLLK
jgi:mono/diheme cytochrome c family protein